MAAGMVVAAGWVGVAERRKKGAVMGREMEAGVAQGRVGRVLEGKATVEQVMEG